MLTKRPCRICRRWFVPDGRVGRRQRACSAPTCQIARRARTQASWRRRNPDYFIAHRIQRRRLNAEEAPVALLELREGSFEFVDNYKGTITGRQRFFPSGTVLAGKKIPTA